MMKRCEISRKPEVFHIRSLTTMKVPDVSAYRARMIDELGLIPQRGFVRMVLGAWAFSGDPGKVLATSGAEKGEVDQGIRCRLTGRCASRMFGLGCTRVEDSMAKELL